MTEIGIQNRLLLWLRKEGLSREIIHLDETVKNLARLPFVLRPDCKGEDFQKPFNGIIDKEMQMNWLGYNKGNLRTLGKISIGKLKPFEIYYGAQWRIGAGDSVGTVFFAHASLSLFKSEQLYFAWANLAKKQFELLCCDFGIIKAGFETNTTSRTHNNGVVLTECLPGLYQLNLFGPNYVKFFGREKLLATPAVSVEEFGNGNICIRLAKSLDDARDPSYIERVAKAKEHLGWDTVYDKDHIMTSYRTPIFDRSELIAGFEHVPVDSQREEELWTKAISSGPEYWALRDKWHERSRDFCKKMRAKGKRLQLKFESFRVLDEYIAELRTQSGDDWLKVKNELISIAVFVADVIATRCQPASVLYLLASKVFGQSSGYNARVDYCCAGSP